MAMLPMIRTSVDRLREEIDQTFDRWLNRRPENEGESALAPVFAAGGMPRIEMEEDEQEYRVKAELPGLEKDDFRVELAGNRLLIKGEKKIEHEEKKSGTYISEFSYGSFSRSIPLPGEVDPAKVEATYKNGILSLRLPKSEPSQAQQIQVKVA